MDFKEPQKIIFELLNLTSEKPTSYYKIEKESNRHYSTVRTYINLLELFEFIEIKKIVNGKYIKYEITITPQGAKIKDKIKNYDEFMRNHG